jgi:hypothetical protein
VLEVLEEATEERTEEDEATIDDELLGAEDATDEVVPQLPITFHT